MTTMMNLRMQTLKLTLLTFVVATLALPSGVLAQKETPAARAARLKRLREMRKRNIEQAKRLRRAARARRAVKTVRAGAIKRPPTPPSQGQPGAKTTAANKEGGGTVAGFKQFNECILVPRNRKLRVTLKPDSDLRDLVGWISTMTCKKFIIASNLRAQKVTLISPTKITPATAYRAFISALDVMGLTVVPSGRYLKVVQGNWAIQNSIPTYTDRQKSRIPRTDQIVTQIIQIKHVDVNELLLVLNKMKSRSGDVTAYRPSNSLIVTEAGVRIRRMLRVIKELDIPSPTEKIWVVRLRNADAQQVSKILSQLFAQKGRKLNVRRNVQVKGRRVRAPIRKKAQADADTTASKIVVDENTNSLIIVSSATAFAKIASLIKKLDVDEGEVNQRIHVYYLANADAEEMAQTLGGVTGGSRGRGNVRRGRRGRVTRGRGRSSGSTSATLFEGDVKVNADKATNSLVIIASTKDYLSLRRVIKRLDIPRRQVFVEAVIMEVSLDKNNSLGLAYHGGKILGSGTDESLAFGGVQHQQWRSLIIDPLSLMGLAAGISGARVDGSSEILGVSTDIPGFGVMFQAMQTDNNINVLSSPHILTTDNEQAEITVGQNLPFQGAFVGGGLGAAAGAAGGAASFLPQVSVQRQDVALKLKITPHVNDSNMVRLELEQEVSDISSPNFSGLGPATSKRTAKTTVVVRDQQTVVIGGMMSERVQNEVSKVPLLGDIPILGYLFKYTARTKAKTNLLIVLTPYVIHDQSDLRRIFKKKLRERREFIERYTNFKPHDIGHEIDYRYKRGLLSHINRVGIKMEKEADLLKAARRDTSEPPTPLDMPAVGPRSSSSPPSAPGTKLPGRPATHNPGLHPSRSVRFKRSPSLR
jgi:general secretion pathway protein D